MQSLALCLALLAGCSGSVPEPADPSSADPPVPTFVLRGARSPGGEAIAIEVQDGVIVAPGTLGPDTRVVDADGLFVVPGVIDAHVHLAYFRVGDELPATGIVGAVDLAAPEAFLDRGPSALRIRASGPMITPIEGYPTQTWGQGGFGIECASPADAERAVERLVARGAALIKLSMQDEPGMDEPTLVAAVARAHALGVKVAAHALSNAEATRAGRAGVDILAHTPVEPLADETVALFADRAVISTLGAFGVRESTIDNLRRLHEAGATIVYGTDLGNTRLARIQPSELELLGEAGLSPREILAATTATPAAYFGFEGLGTLEPGAAASFLLLDEDPSADIVGLASPRAVYVDGVLAR